MLYVILLALAMKFTGMKVWTPVWTSLNMLSQGFIPSALMVLGIQLANTKISFKVPIVYLASFVRLLASPVLAYGLITALGIHGLVGQVLVISSAAPTAVNTILLALEYDNEPEFSSQTVFVTTAFSALTVFMVITLATRWI